jgi:ABC-2 type transport system ATP-binding protein
MNAAAPVIDVVGLTKVFGRKTVVDHLDMQVGRGEIYGFLGPNGSGKTTFIRMLCGLLRPDDGSGTCLGFDVRTQADHIKPQVGYMSQKFSLYEDLSVRENLDFIARMYGVADRAKATARTIERMRLGRFRDQLAGTLSGGWKQRLALAACMIHDPTLLLLDDPTAGVDPMARRDFWDAVHRLAGEGITALISTHYMDEAERCHRLAFVQSGRIVALGTPEEIKRDEMPGQVVEIDCDAPGAALALLRAQPGLEEASLHGAQIHVVTADPEQLQAQVGRLLDGAGIALRSVDIIPPSLEDAFIASVKAQHNTQEDR